MKLNYSNIDMAVDVLVKRYQKNKLLKSVFGIPNGGLIPAALISERLKLPLVESPGRNTLVVDDILDTGKTIARYKDFTKCVLVTKKATGIPYVIKAQATEWVTFPWETVKPSAEIGDNIIRIIEYIGENPKRKDLLETPAQITRLYKQFFHGYKKDPLITIKNNIFKSCNETVNLNEIKFYSFCTCHLLPFTGTVSIVYVTNGKNVNNDTIFRLVETYSHRLQKQKQLTLQIAETIFKELGVSGINVRIKARHFCKIAQATNNQPEIITNSSFGKVRRKDK
ncbi:GTP cyclohydrolase I [Patescibacteria group bacterium]|nr:GTP cyclohydrolase I [Patescibacteria group bacterium]MCL5798353.1 GTP cyclohydrolase I [Patescibacteria group bacterium]